MSGIISVNGTFFKPEQASISVLDRGFLFGDNVFETLVAFHGQILDVHKHVVRLRKSAGELDFEIPWSDAELKFELSAACEQSPNPKQNLRLVVTRGEGLGLATENNLRPNRIIYCFPAQRLDQRFYKEGVDLKRVVSASTERGPTAKTGNYLASIIAMKKAKSEGKDDVLWTNSSGEITEASTANIFFMAREGDNVTFITPPPASGLLLGITRGTILGLMRDAKIPCVEQVVYADELARFDEAFLCSTVRGLLPVRSIDRQTYFTTRPNSVFQHIERLYHTWARVQVGFPFDWNTGEKRS